MKKGFLSLKGKSVTIDHGKSVKDIVGKVEDVWWNEELGRIEGRGIVEDRGIAEKIHNGLITGVSVEVLVGYEKTDAHGVEAREPEFQAISLVKDPACKPPNCGIIM